MECHCLCHRDPTLIHFNTCCEGQCSKCGRFIVIDLADHIAKCEYSYVLNKPKDQKNEER